MTCLLGPDLWVVKRGLVDFEVLNSEVRHCVPLCPLPRVVRAPASPQGLQGLHPLSLAVLMGGCTLEVRRRWRGGPLPFQVDT